MGNSTMGRAASPRTRQSHSPEKNRVLDALRDYPIIPSLRREEQFEDIVNSRARVILLSSGSIFNICDHVERLQRHDKIVLVHIDLISGLGRDQEAVRFLKQTARVDGIVTPNCHAIIAGRKEGMLTVHRLFAYDSPSVETGLKVLQKSNPDFIEILPGLAIIQTLPVLRKHFKQPVIAAGLIKTAQEVRQVMKAGAVAVDTSTEALWSVGSAQSGCK
ncbi:MAG: glycerol-3-phosphate responsive antiterminator [Firmicutes bacterium]|nr:glycerol-3-phosphate responsive antiterminator [Bacillota bacterium]